MSQRQWTQLLIVSLLLLFIARSSAADEAVLLVKSQEILSVASKLEESALVGTTVWVGDNRGARGTATVIPKSGHPHDALLDQDFGIELGLAYSGEARFVPIGATKIAPDAVSILVSKKARELGAGDVQELELAELARVDLDGDNEPELLISAHTKRQPSDPYWSGRRH